MAVFCFQVLFSSAVDAFEALKESFSSLVRTRNISAWVIEPVAILFSEISSAFATRKLSDAELNKACQLVADFLTNEILTESPNSFKHKFLENAVSSSAKDFYSEALFDTISNQLESNTYDDAVLVAFKYLDNHLRKLAEIDTYQFYGEDLINKVFAPIQVNANPLIL